MKFTVRCGRHTETGSSVRCLFTWIQLQGSTIWTFFQRIYKKERKSSVSPREGCFLRFKSWGRTLVFWIFLNDFLFLSIQYPISYESDNGTKRSSCGGWLFGLSSRLLFFSVSPLTARSSSSTSALALALGLSFTFSSDSLSSVLDDVFVLSLLVLPKWKISYFQVRGTTSSVSPRYSERNFLPSLLMK